MEKNRIIRNQINTPTPGTRCNASIPTMKSAPNLILIGPMGAGKTALGKRLAERLGLVFVDADQQIERDTGARIPLIFELEGEAGFRQREHATLARLCANTHQVIATGGGAILHPDTRELLPQRGFVLYLAVDLDTQLRRLRHDRQRPLLQCEDRRTVLSQISARREPLYEAFADLRYDTSHGSLRQGLERLLALLHQHWTLSATTTLENPA